MAVPPTSGRDVITGTAADETFDALEGNDTAFGFGGNDLFIAGAGDDFYVGPGTVLYTSARSTVKLVWTVHYDGEAVGHLSLATDATAGGEGIDSLSGPQRLVFKDGEAIALDIVGTWQGPLGHAGSTAKLIAALFGTARLSQDEAGVGYVLGLFDRGMTEQGFAAAALNYLGVHAPEDVVRLLWGNIVGAPISDASLHHYVGMLESTSAAEFVVLASNSPYNTDRVGLTGFATNDDSLARKGLHYHYVEVPPLPPTAADISPSRTTEGGTLSFTVLLSHSSAETVSLPFELASSDSEPPDWSSISATQGVVVSDGRLIIGPGVQSFDINVQTIDDAVDEPDEIVFLTIGAVRQWGEILDNDGPVFVRSISSADCVEGQLATLDVVLSGAGATATHLQFTVTPRFSADQHWSTITATDGVVIENGGLLVPAGVSAFSLTFQTIDDSVFQSNSAFYVSIDPSSGNGGGAVYISDNDPSVASEESFFPIHGSASYYELGQFLRDDTATGALSAASLRSAIISATGEADYWKLFSVSRIAGPHDGTWTQEEMGLHGYGNLPATPAVLEILVLGGAVYLFGFLTDEDSFALSAYVTAHRADLVASDPSAVDAYVHEIIRLKYDTPVRSLTDAELAHEVVVPFFVHLVQLAGAGQSVDMLHMLPLGWD